MAFDLNKLRESITDNLNKAISEKQEITGEWLQEGIDTFHGMKKETAPDRLLTAIQNYIDTTLPNKSNIAPNTVKKYKALKNKIADYEQHEKKHFFVKDVGVKFGNELTKYFLGDDKLNRNSAGRYVKALKTVCRDAKRYGYEVNNTLAEISSVTQPVSKIYLTKNELEQIEGTAYTRVALENAKNWLIIGCYIGQRVSDFVLTDDNIGVRNGLKVIELTQKKTGKNISIPVHPVVKAILEKRNGNFPEIISDVKFNIHLKDICRIAGINTPTSGNKLT